MLKLKHLLKESRDYEIFAKNFVKKYGNNIPKDENELIELIRKDWVAEATARLGAQKAQQIWRRLVMTDEDFLSDHVSAIRNLQRGALTLPEEKDLYHRPVKAVVTRQEFDKMYDWLEDMNSFTPVKKELNFIMANPNTFKTWDDFHDSVMGAISKYEKLSGKKMPNNIQDILLRHIESELQYYG